LPQNYRPILEALEVPFHVKQELESYTDEELEAGIKNIKQKEKRKIYNWVFN
jgi:hypothetical protein